MNWLKTDNSLKKKFTNDIESDDGIKNILNNFNYVDDPRIGEDLSGKRKIVSWMLKCWAKEFNMYL